MSSHEIPPPPPLGDVPVIRAGEAQLAISRVFDKLSAVFLECEATAMAVARALDDSARKVGQ